MNRNRQNLVYYEKIAPQYRDDLQLLGPSQARRLVADSDSNSQHCRSQIGVASHCATLFPVSVPPPPLSMTCNAMISYEIIGLGNAMIFYEIVALRDRIIPPLSKTPHSTPPSNQVPALPSPPLFTFTTAAQHGITRRVIQCTVKERLYKTSNNYKSLLTDPLPHAEVSSSQDDRKGWT
ncbi:hypothetical protein PoB_004478200 [Plakobranchus ocellatus]|uniref:Uncharacterized protein n=1 Tax=Plakobranchus ocellatus TaxID=259542 RepID=A0AAV4BFV3_9GAST|nr:hypothetical protein PoB_004478200 [Plakobranchus ocellatus]